MWTAGKMDTWKDKETLNKRLRDIYTYRHIYMYICRRGDRNRGKNTKK